LYDIVRFILLPAFDNYYNIEGRIEVYTRVVHILV
jgi:hypothetical protein